MMSMFRRTASGKLIPPWWFPYMFLTLAFLFSAITVWCYRDSQEMLATWQRAEGTIIGFVDSESSTHHRSGGGVIQLHVPAKHALFRFETSNKLIYTVRNGVGSSIRFYDEGETVEVFYPIDNPEKATLNTFSSLYSSCIFFAVFVVGSLFFCVMM